MPTPPNDVDVLLRRTLRSTLQEDIYRKLADYSRTHDISVRAILEALILSLPTPSK